MIDSFMVNAFLIGIIISVLAGFLGCIIVWRRLACFSDSISHSILPGIALGFLFNISIGWSAFFTAIIISLFLEKIKNKSMVSIDTLLIIISQVMFSIGVIIMYSTPEINSNIMNLLLGDILTVSLKEIIFTGLIGFSTTAFLILNWRKIVILCISEEIAISESINIKILNLSVLLLSAIFISISMQTIGIMLSASMLLIPPSIARSIAKSPTSMPYIACFISIIGTLAGISLSYFIDIPPSPAIIVTLGSFLLITFSLKR